MDSRLRLMLITDRRAHPRPIAETVRAALRGGVTAVQLREPDLGAGELLYLAGELREITARAGAALLVNDRVDVAIAAGADGVHLKRSSLPPERAREILGPDRLVGVSTHSADEVRAAFAAGADYVVFGPVFPTPSKEGILGARGAETYFEVAAAAPGPVLALGGISPETLGAFGARRAPGLAAIRSLVATEDPEAAARRLAEWLEATEATA